MNKHYNKKYFEDRDYLDLLIAETIKILMSDNQLKAVLDVGCGTGKLVRFLNKNGFEAVGCDDAKEAVEMARKINKKNSIIQATATKLPFTNLSFDLVTAISVIEHLKDEEVDRFLSEAYRVLKPEGFIFIITPNFSSPARYIFGKKWFGYCDPTHVNFFTPKSLAALLKKHGFSNIRFRLKTAHNVNFTWYLPGFLAKLPMPARNFLNYLMISSPLSTFRDSFWTVAQK